MGDAGNAAWALADTLAGKGKDYVGHWGDETIVGKGSKNIPWLRIATDAVLAVRYNSVAKINAIERAVNGFLSQVMKKGAFHGEEFSTIYTRWILLPMIVVYFALVKMNKIETAQKLRLHIRSITVLAVLSAGKSSTVGHHKGKKGLIHATPYTLFAGSRSWVYGKGDDNKRTLEDEIVWHDASSTLELIDWIIGRNKFQTQGDGWIYKTTRALEKWIGKDIHILTYQEQGMLYSHIDYSFDKTSFNALLNMWREWPVGPQRGDVVIVRGVDGAAFTAYTASYNAGSTSFMQFKDYSPKTNKFITMGVADPRKRTNAEESSAQVYDKPNGKWYVNVMASDNTIWVEDTEVHTSNLELETSVSGAWEYAVYANKEGGLSVLYPAGPDDDDVSPEPDDDDTSVEDRLDVIVDFVYEWLKESGLLAELKKRLIAKALKEMGL